MGVVECVRAWRCVRRRARELGNARSASQSKCVCIHCVKRHCYDNYALTYCLYSNLLSNNYL